MIIEILVVAPGGKPGAFFIAAVSIESVHSHNL